MPAEKTILLVSTSELGLDLEHRILQPAGYLITQVSELKLAQDLLKRSEYNLVIMEDSIKINGGQEWAITLASHNPSLPIILVGQDLDVSTAWRGGFWDILPVPFEPRQVLDSLSHVLVRAQRLVEWAGMEARKTNRRLQHRLGMHESLHRIGRSVSSLLDLDSILTTVVDAAIDLTTAEEASVMLLDETTGELSLQAVRNFKDDIVRKIILPIRDPLPGQVLRTGKYLAINASESQKLSASQRYSQLFVPLMVNNRVIGVLGVYNRQSGQSFHEDHLNLIITLANYAAIAIENARLYNASEAEHKKLETVLNDIEEAVIVIDHENRLVIVNKAACRAFNFESGTLIGRKASDVIQHSDLLEILERSRLHPSQTEINLDDGRVLYAQLTPISAVGTVLTMQDITQLKELDRIKSDFVNMVSHDLRSPLTAILGYVELVERSGPVTEQQREFIQRIQTSAMSITNLLNELLDLSKIETGFDIRKELVSLPVLINSTAEDMQLALENKKQGLELLIAGDLPQVLGNPLHLRQMLSNLVSNAIKFSPQGQTITILAHAEGDQIILQVQDRGPGIPPADQPHIFNKFFRASNVLNDSPGLGLGLAIVKSIVDNHGGRIWVDSILGIGTTFTIVLPIALA